jgi:hypothetical protein
LKNYSSQKQLKFLDRVSDLMMTTAVDMHLKNLDDTASGDRQGEHQQGPGPSPLGEA